jgi:serine/threonine protein kinase
MHAAETQEPSLVGSELCGTYRLTEKLGVGAMGTVYEAEHIRLKRTVAVKILAPKYRNHVAALRRFHNEARALVMLDNPHVVRVLDFSMSADGRPFLVMERLHGTTVAAYLAEKRAFSVASTMAVARDVCEALVEAHSKGIFHRDLKPENLFLVDVPTRKEFVKVLDFGISRVPDPAAPRVTAENEVIGTPEYMSPEQALGLSNRVNGRADQHGLALVMYEMLSGVSPFAAEEVEEALERVSFEMPRLLHEVVPGVSRGLALVLHRALSKDPQERFPGIDDFFKAAQAAVRESTPHSMIPIANDTTRPSMPVARSFASSDPVRTIALLLARTRAALLGGDVATASELACTALDGAELSNDDAVAAVVEMGRPLLENVFHGRLEPLDRRITVVAEEARAAKLPSKPQAALLKAARQYATIAELLNAAPLPRLDALRALVELEADGRIVFVGVPRPRLQSAPASTSSPTSYRARIALKRA